MPLALCHIKAIWSVANHGLTGSVECRNTRATGSLKKTSERFRFGWTMLSKRGSQQSRSNGQTYRGQTSTVRWGCLLVAGIRRRYRARSRTAPHCVRLVRSAGWRRCQASSYSPIRICTRSACPDLAAIAESRRCCSPLRHRKRRFCSGGSNEEDGGEKKIRTVELRVLGLDGDILSWLYGQCDHILIGRCL